MTEKWRSEAARKAWETIRARRGLAPSTTAKGQTAPDVRTMQISDKEVRVSSLEPNEQFACVLTGWGKNYGARFGTVIRHGVGTTLVRWHGELKQTQFNTAKGQAVSFTADGGGTNYIAPETMVSRLIKN